ncbi:hypothetical protein ACQEVG_17670 [Streptomyces sp. CA-135486]
MGGIVLSALLARKPVAVLVRGAGMEPAYAMVTASSPAVTWAPRRSRWS